MTSSTGLDLLPTGPTFKSFGKFSRGHHISTLDQVYVSETVPARAILLPDAVTDHFPVLADLGVRSGRTRPGKGLEIVSKRNLASIDPVAFRTDLRELGVGVQTTSATGETMSNARAFIKNIAKGTPSFELNSVGISTTKKAIRAMGSTKAIGVDGLPCAFWKEYCEDLAPFVNLIINTSIKTGAYPAYPAIFKDAIVVPVFKGGRKDREDPASYRPISVLPALSKVLETIVIDQFLEYLDENNLLPPAQHGFRRGYSTVTALVQTIQKWTSKKCDSIV